jgi:4-hydroxy-2-oxoglutarate aldolase
VALLEAVAADDHGRALDLQRRLAPLGRLVTAELGIAGLKAALDTVGLVGGVPRRPLLPLADAARDRVAAELAASGLVQREF